VRVLVLLSGGRITAILHSAASDAHIAAVAISAAMSSDLGSTADVPSDDILETALRDQVSAAKRADAVHELTVNKVRAAVEEALDLNEGFFKSHVTWKDRSKDIIQRAVVCPYRPCSELHKLMHQAGRGRRER